MNIIIMGNNPFVNGKDHPLRKNILWDTPHMKTLANKLKNLMADRGFNYKTLSLAAHLGETAVRDIIVGRVTSPKISTIKKLAAVLNVPTDYFTSDDEITGDMPKQGFSETEVGLMSAIRAVIVVLSNYDVIRQGDVKNIFTYQQKDFRMRAQPGAAAVMDQLIEFLNDQLPEEKPQKIHKPLRPERDQ